MLNSIIGRHRMLTPLTETEIRIIRSATKLFLHNGFSHTTIRMIADDTGIRPGNINYHFHTKEDMLYMLIQEIMDFHSELVEKLHDGTSDTFVAYATEIASQIALCEGNEKAYDLYYSAYTLPGVYEYIKQWTAKKNYSLLGQELPHMTYDDFLIKENVASAIEFSAFNSPTNERFTLDDKVSLIIDTLLKVYDVPKDIRENTINRVLEIDYRSIGIHLFDEFVDKLDKSVSQVDG